MTVGEKVVEDLDKKEMWRGVTCTSLIRVRTFASIGLQMQSQGACHVE